MTEVLTRYTNGNYNVILLKNGTKIRYNSLDNLTPEFAESIDCTITEKCDGGCEYCYLGCNIHGKHADLNQDFFNSLHKGQELALNGNDLSHPELIEFLNRMKNQGVICNITVNQIHFIREIEKIRFLVNNNLIWGLGISLVNSSDDKLYEYLKEFPNAVIHTIDGLLTKEDIDIMSNKNIKLLILGYKVLGRGINYYNTHKEEIKNNIDYIENNILSIQNDFNVISFDNLAIEHLNLQEKFKNNWEQLYMGNEGEFTFYISATDKTYSISSLESSLVFPIKDNDTVDTMFNHVRKVMGYD